MNKEIVELKDYSTPKKKNNDGLLKTLEANFKAFNTTPEKVKREFLQVLSINPELKKCSPTSLLLAIAQVQGAGVSLNPMNAYVALIPYKNTYGTEAQLQYMWKGYRYILLKDGQNIQDFHSIEIKEDDIKTLNFLTGEITFNKEFYNMDFKYQLERRKKPTIGYASIIMLDETLYKQKSFAIFMTLEEIEIWKAEYGSKTLISGDLYGKKTTAKRVIREFKYKIQWKNTNTINSVLKHDQSINDGEKLEYVEDEQKIKKWK